MADNIKVKPSRQAGAATVATVDISGIHYPVYFLSDENGNYAYVDQYTGAVGSIDQEHLQIHRGNGFTLGKRFTIAEAGGVVDFLGIVPAGTFPHFRTMIVTLDGGPFDVDFYEGTTVSANGAAVSANNNNRNSANTNSMEIYQGPTVTDAGALLEPVLATGNKQSGAIGSDSTNEWILKAGTNYLIRITNNTPGGGSSNASANMFWYE